MGLLKNLITTKKSMTRSISAENPTGTPGKGGMATEGMGKIHARELGLGWKISPCITIAAGETYTIADIHDQGIINHIWMTCRPDRWRSTVIQIYWDDAITPSVQSPLGDFFCHGWNERSVLNSLAVTVNPAGGFNSYWQMAFKKRARIDIINLSVHDLVLYYQVDYELTDLDGEIAYFHAFWKRTNPVPYMDVHTIIDNVEGTGHYVGTYMAIQVNNNNWWGEGEIKFYLDNDQDFPTICGTGTEDYFGGAWNFEQPEGEYHLFSTAYSGLHQIIRPNGTYQANLRFGMYRWHLTDPIRFERKLKVTIQDLGWRSEGRYLPLQDDIATVAYWYQTTPCEGLSLPLDPNMMEVI
ncbi:MAG: glycoside hydrolase family 172 protein [Candidatus Izemoplasmatales bacterium]